MFTGKQQRILGTFIALGLICFLAAQPARAAIVSWDASGNGTAFDGSGNWTLTGSNWWTGALPDSVWNRANVADFGATVGSNSYSINLAQSTSAAGIAFASQFYTVAGTGPLWINTSGITVNASGAINAPITLTGAQTWSVGTGQTLSLGGTTALNGQSLAISGNGVLGTVNFSGNGTMSTIASGGVSGTPQNTIVLNAGTTTFNTTGGIMANLVIECRRHGHELQLSYF